MTTRQRLRTWWFALLTSTVKPLTPRLARSSVGPFSLVRHRGRRSDLVDETP